MIIGFLQFMFLSTGAESLLTSVVSAFQTPFSLLGYVTFA